MSSNILILSPLSISYTNKINSNEIMNLHINNLITKTNKIHKKIDFIYKINPIEEFIL